MNGLEFATNEEAKMFVAHQIDVREDEYERTLPTGLNVRVKSQDLSSGAFTNSYEISFPEGELSTSISIWQYPRPIIDSVRDEDAAVISGGFFLLSDDETEVCEPSLNFAADKMSIRSMPVRDREAVLIRDKKLDIRYLRAMGTLVLNGSTVQWAGSLTDHDGDVTVFANGNLAIDHVPDPKTTTRRVVRKSSRLTPSICDTDRADVGLRRTAPNEFLVADVSYGGQMDILDYDFVARMDRSYARKAEAIQVSTIDDLHLEEIDGGFSAGPFITEEDFDGHPINRDKSLGSRPPFIDRRMARLVLYMTSDGSTNFRLFDGRPDSLFFEGVTPREAQSILCREADIVSGIFLDPGQTAKMYIRSGDSGVTFGNRHYLKWPGRDGDKYIWTPDHGRPITSMIRIQ